jgi:hypothetical protein
MIHTVSGWTWRRWRMATQQGRSRPRRRWRIGSGRTPGCARRPALPAETEACSGLLGGLSACGQVQTVARIRSQTSIPCARGHRPAQARLCWAVSRQRLPSMSTSMQCGRQTCSFDAFKHACRMHACRMQPWFGHKWVALWHLQTLQNCNVAGSGRSHLVDAVARTSLLSDAVLPASSGQRDHVIDPNIADL